MKKLVVILTALLPLLLVGCNESYYRLGAPVKESSSRTRGPRAPVQTPNKRATPKVVEAKPLADADDQEVQIVAYAPPARIRAKPVTSTAVASLVQTADQQHQTGDTTGAAATLERALRIEPRNAHLWHRLAEVRLDQKRYEQAEGLAAKSNALAAADRDLRRDNWQ